jgi:hypothetical protein
MDMNARTYIQREDTAVPGSLADFCSSLSVPTATPVKRPTTERGERAWCCPVHEPVPLRAVTAAGPGLALGPIDVGWPVVELHRVDFGVDDIHAVALAEALKGVLDKPGWYADFHNEREIFVVFPGRVFRYPRGDMASRSEAQAYGRELGIPEPQLDWAD